VTIYHLYALGLLPLAIWLVGLATGDLRAPRWWRRRRWVRRTAERVTRVCPDELEGPQ
jgi:hypothetical protein